MIALSLLAVVAIAASPWAATFEPACDTLKPPFCDCGGGKNCSCTICNSCDNCKRCTICSTPGPPPPPPSPQVPPPADWKKQIDDSSLLYSGEADLGAFVASTKSKLPLYPNIGNGYLGGILGCFKQDVGKEGPTATAGVLHVGGVFNGEGTSSERAEIPGLFSLYPVSAAGKGVKFGGSALDLKAGIFKNRSVLTGCNNTVLEQRWYAHRSVRSLLVYELEIMTTADAGGSCRIEFASCNADPSNIKSTKTTIVSTTPEGVVSSISTTIDAETVNSSLATVASVFARPETVLQMDTHTDTATQRRYLGVLTTSLPEESSAAAEVDPLAAATALFNSLSPNATLRQAHEKAWDELLSTRIELAGEEGDVTARAIAAAVNSSFYYLLSAAREDWPFSTSPGGLANNAYQGHTFWDLATWQYPALAPLYPRLGEALLSYRETRLGAALAFARQSGHVGARFPWESAVSGFNVCGWETGAQFEQHITGDVAMAFRLQYYLTRDVAWLKDHAWPVIRGTAEFWAGRFELDAASGNYTIKHVTGPDESSGEVDDEAYTNAIAAATIALAVECAARVGATPASNWSAIAARPLLPIATGVYDGGAIHQQDKQYKKGKIITQSAVGLLQYPLEVEMPTQLKINDLIYWQAHTADNGFYTGDSSYSIAWLALGNRSGSDAQFSRAFLYMNGLPSADNDTRVVAPQFNPFNVWKEQARDGKHLNFLTGAGGFLQNMLQGYGGLRARLSRLDWNPVLAPHIRSSRFVRLSYAGAVYSLEYDAETMTITVHSSTNLEICAPIASEDCKALIRGAPATLKRGNFSLVST